MKEKILAQLVIKFPGVSKQFLGLWADKMAVKVTDENAIQGAISELDNLPVSITDLAAEYQKEGDRRVTEASKKKPTVKTENTDKTDTEKKDEPEEEKVPAWAKKLTDDVNSLKTEKLQGTMRSKLAEKLKDSKIPEKFYSKIPLPEKEEDLDAFVESIKADYTEVKQGLIDDGLSLTKPPIGGIGVANASAKAIEVDIDKWAGAGKPKEPVKA